MNIGPKAHKLAASHVAKIDGKKLHYLTAGQGPALILLHGYTQTSRMWRPLIDNLQDKFAATPTFRALAIPIFPRTAAT